MSLFPERKKERMSSSFDISESIFFLRWANKKIGAKKCRNKKPTTHEWMRMTKSNRNALGSDSSKWKCYTQQDYRSCNGFNLLWCSDCFSSLFSIPNAMLTESRYVTCSSVFADDFVELHHFHFFFHFIFFLRSHKFHREIWKKKKKSARTLCSSWVKWLN